MNEPQVAAVIEEVKSAYGDLSRIHGVDGFFRLLPCTVKSVEKVVGSLRGEDKKEVALDVLFKLVKLPWWLPVSFLRPLLGAAIDMAVDLIKSKLK